MSELCLTGSEWAMLSAVEPGCCVYVWVSKHCYLAIVGQNNPRRGVEVLLLNDGSPVIAHVSHGKCLKLQGKLSISVDTTCAVEKAGSRDYLWGDLVSNNDGLFAISKLSPRENQPDTLAFELTNFEFRHAEYEGLIFRTWSLLFSQDEFSQPTTIFRCPEVSDE